MDRFLDQLHGSLSSASDFVAVRARLEEALKLAQSPLEFLREEGFSCLARTFADALTLSTAFEDACRALDTYQDTVLSTVLKAIDDWNPHQVSNKWHYLRQVSLREFECAMLTLQGLSLSSPAFREASRARGMIEVLLRKLEFGHQATSQLCLQSLGTLLCGSISNIRRFSEVQGFEQVLSLLKNPCLTSHFRAQSAELLNLVASSLNLPNLSHNQSASDPSRVLQQKLLQKLHQTCLQQVGPAAAQVIMQDLHATSDLQLLQTHMQTASLSAVALLAE